MAQVKIYWNEFNENALHESAVIKLNSQLSSSFQLDLANSKQPQRLSFYAKLMLNNILEKDFLLVNTLTSFEKDEHGKPSIKHKNLHFNISHSDNLVGIAICDKAAIGFDLQKIKPFSARITERVFDEKEIQKHKESNNPDHFFFDTWSKKEACVKAAGRGIITGLTTFNVIDKTVILDQKELHLQKIDITEGFSAAIAVDHSIDKVTIINYNELT